MAVGYGEHFFDFFHDPLSPVPGGLPEFDQRLEREIAHLWVFLEQEGVSPTNNHAERMIRFAVLWRKCSQGTSSDKGNRWVERILTLRQTCRLAL